MARAAAIENEGLFRIDPVMRTPLIASAILHVSLFILSVVGLPYIARDNIVISPPINVEILTIEDISQTNFVAPPAKKQPEPKEEPPPPKQEKPKPPEMTAEQPPDIPKPEPVVNDVPEPKPTEKLKEKPKPKPKKPEATKTEEPKKQEEAFESLLKNLTPKTEEPSQNETAETGKGSQLSQVASLSDRLSISEEDALRRQLAQCWNVLSGAKYAEDLVVEVRIVVNPDRTVQQASILNQLRYTADSQFRAAADAALRALRNPRCTPLELPLGKYDQWKNTVIRFDPSQML